MYDVNVYAVRKHGVIHITLSGNLADSCHTATIKDKYPGGGIVYIADPGTAQIFVEEIVTPIQGICTMSLVPWVAHAYVPDAAHKEVVVFVNGEPVAKFNVKDEPVEYRVIALTASPSGASTGCSIIPADAHYLAIYSSVYGPASRADCEQWREKHCATK